MKDHAATRHQNGACNCGHAHFGAFTRRGLLAGTSAVLGGVLADSTLGRIVAQTSQARPGGIIDVHHHISPPSFITVVEDKPVSGGGGGYGPYFGSIPDFGEVKDGVRFSDVRPGSPAAKAGLKAGDILVRFGDKPIHNLYDFTDALRRSKVGEVVEVKVLRDGQPITASVKLEQRK